MLTFKTFSLAAATAVALTFGAAGCQPERPDVVPSTAQMWESGNQMMHYEAPADGMVYVYDHTSQRLIWSGQVRRGDAVDVDTQKGQIMTGGRVVVNKLAAPGDQKDIYFDPATAPSQPPVNTSNSNGNGVIVTPNVTVQPSNGSSTSNGVTVQPGVNVAPSGSQTNP